MINWKPDSIQQYRDVQSIWNFHHGKTLQQLWRSSRDNARTPVQWSGEENAGFTTGKPWMQVNPNYPQINVVQQEADPDSILHFYRKAIALRKSATVVRWGDYREHYALSNKIYCYSRSMEGQKMLVVCSYSHKSIKFRGPKGFDLASGKLALSNYPQGEESLLRPWECRVYLWEN